MKRKRGFFDVYCHIFPNISPGENDTFHNRKNSASADPSSYTAIKKECAKAHSFFII
ncbi:MAG: hypothetical protein SOX85_09555 [Lachnospiraceae bacterium]|nr:hypothetical protein [Lachnospiraceae bacterium]